MSRCGSLMGTVSQTTLARSACRGLWRRGFEHGSPAANRSRTSDPAEAVDLGFEAGSFVGVADAEAFRGGQAQDADLALVGVGVHVAGGLADVLHRVGLGQGGVDQAA